MIGWDLKIRFRKSSTNKPQLLAKHGIMQLETPIAFCIFNRPELTARVFEAIQRARPKQLLVIADGPREDRPGEPETVAQTRAILDRVDWDCDVKTNFSPTNLGCRTRMASGLTWAFEQAEELIVLEDDCLPDPTFFDFAQSLLRHYRDDDRVMTISGNNFQPGPSSNNSYYFSRWAHIWGWASWRRAWQHYDLEIKSWPNDKSTNFLSNAVDSPVELQYWSNVYDQIHRGEIDTWDFSWAYALWKHNGLAILPETNLVTNLGFGETATHTIDPDAKLANLPMGSIDQIIHPPRVERNIAADIFTWENIMAPPANDPMLLPISKKQNPPKWHRRLLRSFTRK